MATNEKDVILDIKVRYDEALKKIGELKVANEGLKKEEKDLQKAYKEGNITREELNNELSKTQEQYIKNSQGIKTLNKEVQYSIRYEQAQAGSIEKLRAELSLNVAAYNKLSEAEKQVVGASFEQRINETTVALKEAEEALGDHRRSVGDYGKAQMGLKRELPQKGKSF